MHQNRGLGQKTRALAAHQNKRACCRMNTWRAENMQVLYSLVQNWIFARPLLRRPKRLKDIVATQMASLVHLQGNIFSWCLWLGGMLVAAKCMNYICTACSTPGIVGTLWKEHMTGSLNQWVLYSMCSTEFLPGLPWEVWGDPKTLWQPRCSFIAASSGNVFSWCLWWGVTPVAAKCMNYICCTCSTPELYNGHAVEWTYGWLTTGKFFTALCNTELLPGLPRRPKKL